ncbi:preprotein translocase subunit YajC [bacterium]|jgi:preprotein translocase subunit YajC|nr:preprotein translocase subunit YajC [bacterium]|tara:strand:+ start:319 stop:567 length:249 start_codon:yes stop_codon:yes gene_type:complete
MNEIITLLPLITVFIIFYVILYIPQRRRQKKHKEYVENLKIGDNVITDSGIFGRVVNIKEEKVTLVVKKGEIEILKSNISYK